MPSRGRRRPSLLRLSRHRFPQADARSRQAARVSARCAHPSRRNPAAAQPRLAGVPRAARLIVLWLRSAACSWVSPKRTDITLRAPFLAQLFPVFQPFPDLALKAAVRRIVELFSAQRLGKVVLA